MRAFLLLISALWLASFPVLAEAQSAERLNVVSKGQLLHFDETRQLSIKSWLQQLMLSALERDVVQESSLDEWQEALSSTTRIHYVQASTATMSFDEALVPANGGYPEFVFVRRGERVLRLAKYDPEVFQRLVSAAGLL